jgi:YidC/Oxa1 family membrane protein insertase
VGIFEPLYDLVSWIILRIHSGLTGIGLDADGGWAWGLSIVGLVIIIRIALIPLFFRQIRASRNMQVLQPRIREIQNKYKNDRERQSQELMKLYRETGTNPLSSCLPILAQAPFFLALFQVLNGIAAGHPKGVLTEEDVASAQQAHIFGASISAKFIGSNSLTVQIVTIVMIVLMSLSQFITQRQLMLKNLPVDATKNNPYLQQQKILLYVFPIMFAVFGVNFPVGVLLYWLVSNFWTMGQQFYVIRRNPTPGSIAHDALQKRRADKAAKKDTDQTAGKDASTAAKDGSPVGKRAVPPPAKADNGEPVVVGGTGSAEPSSGGPRKPTRNQPQRASRSQRSGKKKRRR